MIFLAFLALSSSPLPIKGQVMLDEVVSRLKRVHALSVTLRTAYPKLGAKATERFQLLDGRYLRYENADKVALVEPSEAWLIWPRDKKYLRKPPPKKGAPKNPLLGMPGLFGESDLPAVGNVVGAKWQGHAAYRVEIDASKKLPKHPRLYYYFDRATKLPLGFQLFQDLFEADAQYVDLKLDPPLTPRDFEFRPGKGWKLR